MPKRGKDVVEASAGRSWEYTPEMWFFHRMIERAEIDCMAVMRFPCPYLAHDASAAAWEAWDTAVMARAWIARASDPRGDRITYLASFDHCCEALGWGADAKRVELLTKIDAAADYDTDEVWERIEYLTANPPDETADALFDAPRVVPELDQMTMFGFMGAAA